MTTQDFKNSLKTLPIKELEAKIAYYGSFAPRGINYQRMLDLHEAELERRFLAWEAAEV